MNEIRAVFGPSRYCKTARRYQWDKGQKIVFDGIQLPAAYRVDFSTDPRSGATVSQIGNDSGVHVPNKLFEAGENIFAWLVLTGDQEDERTVYVAEIPIIKRPKPEEVEPTPEEQTVIQQAIAALNSAAKTRIYVDDNDYLRFEQEGGK